MARIIVSILSNHSVPNFLFIKEMEGQYDRHLFVTSPEIGQLGRKGQLIAENGGYPPTQNGDIRSLFWLFSLMALQN